MKDKPISFWSTPKGWAALGLIGAATYFLLMEHRQHVWQYLCTAGIVATARIEAVRGQALVDVRIKSAKVLKASTVNNSD